MKYLLKLYFLILKSIFFFPAKKKMKKKMRSKTITQFKPGEELRVLTLTQ